MTNSNSFFFFYFDIVFAILFLYSAWVNLVRKRISKYGADAFIFILYNLIAKEKVEKFQLRENPQFIGRMGFLTVILGFSFLNAAMEELRIIWPYLQ
jgi:hypothetical protein